MAEKEMPVRESPVVEEARRLLEQVEPKLAAVKEAARNNELDVLNREHHAAWSDIEALLGVVRALLAAPDLSHGEQDNHHNALKCPYCNPQRLSLCLDPSAHRRCSRFASGIPMQVSALMN